MLMYAHCCSIVSILPTGWERSSVSCDPHLHISLRLTSRMAAEGQVQTVDVTSLDVPQVRLPCAKTSCLMFENNLSSS